MLNKLEVTSTICGCFPAFGQPPRPDRQRRRGKNEKSTTRKAKQPGRSFIHIWVWALYIRIRYSLPKGFIWSCRRTPKQSRAHSNRRVIPTRARLPLQRVVESVRAPDQYLIHKSPKRNSSTKTQDMALLVDRHRPRSLDQLTYHKDLSERLRSLVHPLFNIYIYTHY